MHNTCATMPIRYDTGPYDRAQLGFVLIPNSQLVEREMGRWAPAGVGLHYARGIMPRETTIASLSVMGDSLASAADTLLPGDRLDVIAYACTSGSLILGEERVGAALSRGHPEAHVTSTIKAVMTALRSVKATRITVATAYENDINVAEAHYLANYGFEISTIAGLGLRYDSDIIRVAPGFIADFACSVDRDDANALFISCAAFRAVEVVEEIERRINKPVITSNQALLWHCLRLAGVSDHLTGCGRLFREW